MMSLWLFNVYMDVVIKEGEIKMGRIGVRFLEESKEWRLPGRCLGFMWGAGGRLKVMLARFVEVCMRRGLKLNADKGKAVVLGGEEGWNVRRV